MHMTLALITIAALAHTVREFAREMRGWRW